MNLEALSNRASKNSEIKDAVNGLVGRSAFVELVYFVFLPQTIGKEYEVQAESDADWRETLKKFNVKIEEINKRYG